MKRDYKLKTILSSDCRNKNYNVMINGQNFFDQPVRNNLIAHNSIHKLQQVKEMITQLVVCWTIIISKTIRR